MREGDPTEVGVLVGRFQTHMLHEGHRELLDEVISRHQQVIVFLGVHKGIKSTRRNPLDYQTRKTMLQEAYPDVTILPIADCPSDEQWSQTLDARISETFDGMSVTMYGSRDSFAESYSGKHPVVELEPSFVMSGTAVRKSISHTVGAHAMFRQGIIYAASTRFITSYQVVDAILFKGGDDPSLLLGQKKTDVDKWRFFGGFVDPKDKSLEAAARRELLEEAGDLTLEGDAQYLGSFQVDDWRYRDILDTMMTAVFLFEYASGDPVANDDIDEVTWVPLKDLDPEMLVPEHRQIFQMFQDYQRRSNNEN